MNGIEHFITNYVAAAWIILAVAFFILAKSADIFVDSSISLANRFKIPRLVIGIVLVSLATTAPELAVSLMSAIRGNPEMALGNAIGSVICDDGLALALCGIFAAGAIPILPHVLKTSAAFLIFIEILAFIFVFNDYTLNRWEGMVLLLCFIGYMAFLFHQHKSGKLQDEDMEEADTESAASVGKICLMFAISLFGIIFASDFVVMSATSIATSFNVPPAIIALTLVAFGTSIPEVATCITAARKGEGALAVGNILGADIMNICWVAGASALVNDLTLDKANIYFMFPAMFIIVGAMLIMLRWNYNLTRRKGLVLLALYIVYLAASYIAF